MHTVVLQLRLPVLILACIYHGWNSCFPTIALVNSSSLLAMYVACMPHAMYSREILIRAMQSSEPYH